MQAPSISRLNIQKCQPFTALHGHTPPQKPPGKNKPNIQTLNMHNCHNRESYAIKIKLLSDTYGPWC